MSIHFISFALSLFISFALFTAPRPLSIIPLPLGYGLGRIPFFMIQFKRFDHILITIPLGTTELARTFYGEILALSSIPGGHPHQAIWFLMGDVQLHIREEAEGPLSSRHPAFEVADLADAKQFLTARGIELAYSSEIEGRDRVFFRDPFGNRFELIQYKERPPRGERDKE